MIRKPLVIALFVIALAAPVARAESVLDFVIVNSTGYGISELYVAPSDSEEWGESLLDEVLENGEEVALEFSPEATAAEWDILIVFVDDEEEVYWRGYDLSEISRITLEYDRNTGETSAIIE